MIYIIRDILPIQAPVYLKTPARPQQGQNMTRQRAQQPRLQAACQYRDPQINNCGQYQGAQAPPNPRLPEGRVAVINLPRVG